MNFKSKKIRIFAMVVAVVCVLTIFAGCGTDNYDYMPADSAELGIAKNEANNMLSDGAEESFEDTQKFVVTGEISCKTEDYEKLRKEFENFVSDANGYFENINILGNSSDRNQRMNCVVKIPAEKTEELMKFLEDRTAIGSESLNKENVTSEYNMLEAKYETLLTSEERLNELLSKAEDLNTILTLEKQLDEIRQEIKYIDNTRKTLSNNINYATIKVVITAQYEPIIYEEEKPTFFGRLWDTFKTSWKEFAKFGEGLLNIIVFLLPTSLLLAVIGLIVIFIIRRSKKSRRKKQQDNTKIQ